MKRTQLPKPLQDLLRRIPYATVATVGKDGQPWNSPVFARWDDDLNVYWVSHKQAQHSKNIAHNPRIFVVVYDSTVPEGEGLGLYLAMRARLLKTAEEVAHAKAIYDTSFFAHNYTNHEQFLAGCPQGFYVASPDHIWFNVDSNTKDGHFIDARQEFPVPRI